jgi:hypothetical protein
MSTKARSPRKDPPAASRDALARRKPPARSPNTRLPRKDASVQRAAASARGIGANVANVANGARGGNGSRKMPAAAGAAELDHPNGLAAQREMLALIETSGELSDSRYEPRDLPSAITLARMIAASPLCPQPLRGREADVLLVMMTGADMGLTTMQSLRNLHVINGRVGLSAAMIRGRCQKHPDCEIFEVAEADAAHAVIEVKKRSWGERRLVAWTLEDAQRAGLVQPDSLWGKWPQEMCVARATTRAASMYFPEVTSGLLSEEDLREMPPDPGPAAAGLVDEAGRLAMSSLDLFASACGPDEATEGPPDEDAEADAAPPSAPTAAGNGRDRK